MSTVKHRSCSRIQKAHGVTFCIEDSWMKKLRGWDIDEAMAYPIHHDQFCPCAFLLQGFPYKVGNHFPYTTCAVIPHHVSSSMILNGFQLVDAGLGVRIPDGWCIVQDWSDHTLAALLYYGRGSLTDSFWEMPECCWPYRPGLHVYSTRGSLLDSAAYWSFFSQFGFVPGRGTTDAIFVVRQLQEKYLAANKRLTMAFVDLEKAFDWVPRKVIWWALRKLGVEECIERLVQGMYANARSRVCVGEGTVKSLKWRLVFTKDQYSACCSSSLCLKALSQEFRSGVPWEDLYANDLVIIAKSLEECVRRLLTWKEAMEKKGLRGLVNAGKTKIIICGTGLDLLQSSGEFPCAVCRTGVGSNSIFCNGCKHWVHKKCSGLKHLKKDPDYRCTRCQGTAPPLDGRPQKEVQVRPDKLEVVASFCYLGDMLSAAGGCELLTTTHVKTAWKKFKDLLPVLFSRHPSFKTRGRVYSSCVWSAMRDLATDKAERPASLAKWQGNDQTDLQCQAARHCHHQVQWATCAAWHWGSGPHSEGEKTPMVWTCGTLQWCS